MLTNTTEIGTATLPRRRLTIPAPTDVSPSAPRRPPRFPALAWAALALLGLLAHPSPAAAQTDVWTATLTPADFGSGLLGCNNASATSKCSTATVLSDDDFTYDSTDYSVTTLYLNATAFTLTVDTDITAATNALTVVVGSTSLAFAAAIQDTARTRTWFNPGFSWTAGTAVSIRIPDTTPPELTSAAVAADGNSITVTFDESVDQTNLPAAGAFSVAADGAPVTVSGVSAGTAAQLVLALAAPGIRAGQVVTLGYTDPTAGDDTSAVQDTSGNDAVSFSDYSVTNNSIVVTVPSDWSLKPTGLAVGDQFRLLFLSSTKRDGSSTDIATYNTFIQTRAAAGHADIRTYSTGFRAVGCTADTDARDTTYTTYTSTDKGVPIYWLNGAKAADQYEDFYDGTWDDEANDKNESGTNGPNTSLEANYPLTGCNDRGTEYFDRFNRSSALAKIEVMVGRPNSSAAASHGPLSSNTALDVSNTVTRPMYGLSAIFQVAADTTPPTLTSAEVDVGEGMGVSFEFSENLQRSNPPPASAFTVTVDGSAATVSSVGVPGSLVPQNQLFLTVSPVITQGQAVVVSYTDPTASDDASAIQDVAGNDAASFTTGSDGVPAVINASIVVPAATEVPADWSLKPTAVTAGTQFRLLFLSSTKRNATSTDIADYNTFIQGRAAAGHADIQTYSTGFRAVGCTAAVDARDNTYTTYTSTDKGVPIYWLNGAKAADEYEDFYDGSWDDEANDKNESGTNGPDTSQNNNLPVTGCSHDGTELTTFGSSRALGAAQVSVGRPNSSGSGRGPLFADALIESGFSRPMYGLSGVFQVAAAVVVPNNPPTVANAIPDQSATAGTAFSYAFPDTTFTDADTGDTLSYTATKADDTALPTWLAFAASTRTFSGTPQAADIATVAVKVTASDGNGGSVSDTFDITVAADTTPPTLTSAGVNEAGLFILLGFSENLQLSNLPPASAFTVTAGGSAVTVSGVLPRPGAPDVFVITVSPAIRQGQAIVVTYTDPTAGDDATAFQDIAGNDAATFTTGMDGVPAVTNSSTFTNTPATGAPTITGTAQVGQTLTAGTTAIMDADGLTSVSYTYQWIRTAAGVDTNISGAMASTYTLVAADLGTTVKVRVSFTDDASNAETLTSAATAVVAAAPNTLPSASDGTVTTNEDSAHTFAAADFNFLDTDPGDTLESVEIITLPASGTGTLALSGTPVTANQVVAATNIGVLAYTPPANANGTGYASFTFKVSDGTAESAAAYTMTITVTAVNDAPTVATAIPDQPATVGTAFSYAFPANTFSDADTGDMLSYTATKADGATLPTWLSFAADTRTFSGTPQTADVGTVSVKVTASDGNGGSGSDDFDIMVSAAANTPATGAPAITGTAQVGQTLTAVTTGIMDADGLTSVNYMYQWIRVDGGTETNISGATASTHMLVTADQGKTIKVKVSFTDDLNNPETLTSAATAAVSAAPNTLPLASDGTVTTNEDSAHTFAAADFNFLDTDPGDTLESVEIITLPASGTGTLALSGTPVTANQVVAATNIGVLAYTPPANANGTGYASFTFKVSDGTAESAADYTMTITVTAVNDAPTVATAIPDQPATVGTAFSYAFPANTFSDADTGDMLSYTATKADGATLPTWLSFAADTRTFSGTPQTADVGTVSVKVTASDGNGGSGSDDFDIMVSAAANTPATGAPAITGTAQVGQTLTAVTTGIMDADGLTSVNYMYQWIRVDGTDADISGATSITYTLVGADLGKTIKVKVIFTDDASNPETLTSAATAVVSAAANTPATGAPTITGTAQVGQTLTAGTAAIVDADGLTSVSYTYQWIRVATDNTETNISGATASTHTLVAADQGTTIKVKVSFTDDASNPETLTSAATAAVTATTGQTTVTFGASSYTATEGGAAAAVTVALSAAPSASVTIPLTTAHLNGATAADHAGIPATVTFGTNQTVMTFTVTATDDADTDGGESVQLGFGTLPGGYAPGARRTATVTLVDNDANLIVNFGTERHTTVKVLESDTVWHRFIFSLSTSRDGPPNGNPQQPVTIPLVVTHRGGATPADYEVRGRRTLTSVTFGVGQSVTDFSMRAIPDGRRETGEGLRLDFGPLPPGVRAGTWGPYETIAFVDQELPGYTVLFGAEAYTATEGGAPARVSIHLSEPVEIEPLVVRLVVTHVGATAADYTGIPSSVTFGVGEQTQTITVKATDDTDDDDGESVTLSFVNDPNGRVRVRTGPASATVALADNDGLRRVTVSFGAVTYTASEGGGDATVRVELDAAPGRSVTVPLTKAHLGNATAADYSGIPMNVTFAANQTSRTFAVMATAGDGSDGGESVSIGFGTLPEGVFAGSPAATTVTLADGGEQRLVVNFGSSRGHTVQVREGARRLRLNVLLDSSPRRPVTIPLVVTHVGGATEADYAAIPESVTFAAGQTSAHYYVRALPDEEDETGEGLQLDFGPLPPGVRKGTWGPYETIDFLDPAPAALLPAFAAFRLLTSGNASAQDSVESDRAVLVALYNATDGPNWTGNTHWLSNEPLSEWRGVGVNDDGRVTALWLFGNQLTGEIPVELSQLSQLQLLYLSSNQLTGEIPVELSQLSQLQDLSLDSNQLTGEIPVELSQLSQLQLLYLYSNRLTGEIPAELGDLAQLTGLYLHGNELNGPIPSWLVNLTELRELSLWSNRLTGTIPPEVAPAQDRAALVVLYLQTDGPNWTDNTNWARSREPLSEWHGVSTDEQGRVEELRLSANGLNGTIGAELGVLTRLTGLSLNDNELTGTIPPELENLTQLQVFDIRNTGLCVTADSELHTWIATIQDFQGTATCGASNLVANFVNGNNGAFNSRVYLWNPSESSGDVTVRVFTLPLTGGLAQELTAAPLNLGTLGAKSALNVKVAEDILAPLGITLPYTNNEGGLTLEFTIQAVDVRGATQVFSSSLAFGTHPLQEIPSTSSGSPTVLVANFVNGNTDAFSSRAYLFNPSDSDGNVTVRVFTLPLSDGTAQELTGTPLDLGTLEARSALNLKLAEDILTPLGITTPYTTDGGNLTLEFTIEVADVRGAAQVFSSSFAFGVYPLQEIPSTSSGSPTVLVANFMNGNSDAFSSRAYLFNPSDSDGTVTVRVFTLPQTGNSSLLGTLDLGSLQAESARNLKLAEDILAPLGIALPYVTDGGNLTLEFTIQAADARGVAQVFSSDFAFGTYPMQEIPSTSSESPTVLVANFMNGNDAALNSRVYLWNPSLSAGSVTVRVFTLPLTAGVAQELTTAPLDLGTLGAESARNLKLVEDILTPLGIPTPYVTDGGNLTLEFTIQAADVRGAAQVFSSSFAFGTVPLQVIQ